MIEGLSSSSRADAVPSFPPPPRRRPLFRGKGSSMRLGWFSRLLYVLTMVSQSHVSLGRSRLRYAISSPSGAGASPSSTISYRLATTSPSRPPSARVPSDISL